MTDPPTTSIPGPLAKEVHTRLKNLCTWGVVQHRVRDHGGALLSLTCVQNRTTRFADTEDPEVAALVDLLRELVNAHERMSWAKLIRVVLALDDQYLDLTAEERRRIAGQTFRGGRNPVGAGTIRKHHEPRAVRTLADLLLGVEAAGLNGKT